MNEKTYMILCGIIIFVVTVGNYVLFAGDSSSNTRTHSGGGYYYGGSSGGHK